MHTGKMPRLPVLRFQEGPGRATCLGKNGVKADIGTGDEPGRGELRPKREESEGEEDGESECKMSGQMKARKPNGEAGAGRGSIDQKQSWPGVQWRRDNGNGNWIRKSARRSDVGEWHRRRAPAQKMAKAVERVRAIAAGKRREAEAGERGTEAVLGKPLRW